MNRLRPNAEDCLVTEIQSFTCVAEKGAFSIKLGEQVIPNIFVNTTALTLKRRFEQLEGVVSVVVNITSASSNPYHYNKVCSPEGNQVLVHFERVFFPQLHGNLPPLLFKAENDFGDMRTELPLGSEDVFLQNFNKSKVSLRGEELRAGQNKTNAPAFYFEGNGTDTLLFIYTVDFGDNTQALDVVGFDFSGGYIADKRGMRISEIVLPEFSNAERYLSSLPSSLSYNQRLEVTSALPSVTYVSSPNASRVYTGGDTLFVTVKFNLLVQVENADRITLQLATGVFSRGMPCVLVVQPTDKFSADWGAKNEDGEGTVLVFRYDVLPPDVSEALDVTDPLTALSLNGGEVFRLLRGGKTLSASTVLPTVGSFSSLSVRSKLKINTQAPVVISVTPPPPRPNGGSYTAGDLLPVQVLFNTPVTVTNSPRIKIATPSLLYTNVRLRTAPLSPQLSFRRARAGETVQLALAFNFNFPMDAGQELSLYLPHVDISFINASSDATRHVEVVGEYIARDGGRGNVHMVGRFHENGGVLSVVNIIPLPPFARISVLVSARYGLRAIPTGISAPFQETFTLNGIVGMQDNPFKSYSAVGVLSTSLFIDRPSYDSLLSTVIFSFSLPDYLQRGDYIVLYFSSFLYTDSLLANMDCKTGQLINGTMCFGVLHDSNLPSIAFSYTLDSASNTLVLTSQQESLEMDAVYSLNLSSVSSFFLSDRGVRVGDVRIPYLDSKLSGRVEELNVKNITRVCSISSNEMKTSVEYLSYQPNAVTAVRFLFTLNHVLLSKGDRVTFTLPHFAHASFFDIDPKNILANPRFSQDFRISIRGKDVVFAYFPLSNSDWIVEEEILDFTLLESVGISAPSSVVRSQDYFFISYELKDCNVYAPRRIYYSKASQIVAVTDARAYLFSNMTSLAGLGSGPSTRENVGISLLFRAARGELILYPHDRIIITLPYFRREASANSYIGNHTVSNILPHVNILFNHRLHQLELTVTALINTSTLNSIILVNISLSAGFYTPTQYSILSNALNLSILSPESGRLNGVILTNDCVGICSISSSFSRHITYTPTSLRLFFTHSAPLMHGALVSFYLPFISLSASTSSVVATFGNASIPINFNSQTLTNGFATIYTVVNVSLLQLIPAKTGVVLTISNIQFEASAVSMVADTNNADESPMLTVKTSATSNDAISWFLYYPERIYANVLLSSSNFTIYDVVNSQSSADRYLFRLSIQSAVPNGFRNIGDDTRLKLLMPSFHTASLNSSGTVTVNGQHVSFVDETLIIPLPGTTSSDLVFIIEDLYPGLGSVGERDLQYSVNYIASSSIPSDIGSSGWYNVSLSEQIIVFREVDVSFSTLGGGQIDEIIVSFETSSTVFAGDIIHFYLPQLRIANSSVSSVQLNVLLGSSAHSSALISGNATVSYDDATSFLTIALSTDFSLADTSTPNFFKLDGRDLLLIQAGIAYASSSFRVLYDSIQYREKGFLFTHIGSLPCFGLCEASLNLAVSNPSRATNSLFSFVLSSITVESYIEVSLPGFSVNNNGKYSVSGNAFSLVTGRSFDNIFNTTCELQSLDALIDVAFIWSASTRSLLFYVANTTSNRQQLLAYSSNGYDVGVSCFVDEGFGLIAPSSGIRKTQRFDVNFSLSGVDMLFISPNSMLSTVVGGTDQSLLIINPASPNKPVALKISFIFKDDLVRNDIIRVFLPSFVINSDVIPLLNVSHDMRAVASMVSSIPHVNVTLREDVAAGTEIFASIASEFIRSPYVGVVTASSNGDGFKYRAPYYSVYSSSSPIAGKNFGYHTSIGTSDSGELGMTTDLAAGSIILDISLVTNCILLGGDMLEIRLPNVLYTPIMNVSSSSWLTVLLAQHANSSQSVRFNASYDEFSSYLALTVASSFVSSGKIILRIELSSHTFSLSNEAFYTNDPRYSYKVSGALCVADVTSFAKSSPRFVSAASAAFFSESVLDDGTEFIRFSLRLNLVGAGYIPQKNDKLVFYVYNALLYVGDGLVCNSSASIAVAGNAQNFFSNDAVVFCNDTKQILAIEMQFTRSYTGDADSYFDVIFYPSYASRNVSGRIAVPGGNLDAFNRANSYLMYELINSTSNVATLLKFVVQENVEGALSHGIYFGYIVDVDGLGLLQDVYIEILSPQPSTLTALRITFACSLKINIQDTILVYLPGFSLSHGSEIALGIYLSEDNTLQMGYVFWASNSTLKLTALTQVSSYDLVSVVVPATAGLTTPARGIPYTPSSDMGETGAYSIEIWRRDGSLFVRNQTLADNQISLVPFVYDSSISYIDFEDSYTEYFGGEHNLLLLNSDHPFTNDDIDTSLVIDGHIYHIKDVRGDIVELYEKYAGPRIFLSNPDVRVYSPPYRYAYYLSGSNTDTITFQYRAARSDAFQVFALGKGIPSITNLYKNVSIGVSDQLSTSMYLIDSYNGSILRSSQAPMIVVSPLLPTISENNASVSSLAARITDIFTTSPVSTLYGMNGVFDIWLRFDREVVLVGEDNIGYPADFPVRPSPKLLLNLRYNSSMPIPTDVSDTDTQAAVYFRGSGTREMLFLYTVQSFDEVGNLLEGVLQEHPFLQQPLRIITANKAVSLKSAASQPYLLADLALAYSSTSVDLERNIEFQGDSAKVVRTYTYEQPLGESFSAGDILYIAVEFDQEVVIKDADSHQPIIDHQEIDWDALGNLGSISVPYLLLEVGRSDPGIALYSYTLSDKKTFIFSYKVHKDDDISRSDSVALTCTCSDYFQRTYMLLPTRNMTIEDVVRSYNQQLYIPEAHKDDHRTFYNVTDTSPFTLYLESVANRKHASMQLLPVNIYNISDVDRYLYPAIKIDNSIPRILEASVNISRLHDINLAYNVESSFYDYIGAGDVMLLAIKYSANVILLGDVHIELMSDNGAVHYSHYYSGNNTDTLFFLYPIALASNRARLEFNGVNAVNTDSGRIFRRSANPTIVADNRLEAPETLLSISRRMNVRIDTQPPAVQSAQFMGHVYNYGCDKLYCDETASLGHSITMLPTGSLTYNIISQPIDPTSDAETYLYRLLNSCACQLYVARDQESQVSSLQSYAYNESDVMLDSHHYDLSHDSPSVNYDPQLKDASLYSYAAWTLYDRFQRGLNNLPVNISTCFSWWRNYNVARRLVIDLKFDRSVHLACTCPHSDLICSCDENNEGILDNVALEISALDSFNSPSYEGRRILSRGFATNYHLDFFLYVKSPNVPFDNKQFFQLQYNGLYSRCIPLTISDHELLQEIRSFPDLNRYQPKVYRYLDIRSKADDASKRADFAVFRISFEYLPEGTLEVVNSNNAGLGSDSLCYSSLVGSDEVFFANRYDRVNFVYDSFPDNALVWRIRDTGLLAGRYKFTINSLPFFFHQSQPRNSISVEHFSNRDKMIGRILTDNNQVFKVAYSNLYFGANALPEDYIYDLRLDICLYQDFSTIPNVAFTIYLPGFNTSNSFNLDLSSNYERLVFDVDGQAQRLALSMDYSSESSTLHIVTGSVAQQDYCLRVRPKESLDRSLLSSFLRVPSRIVYQNGRNRNLQLDEYRANSLNIIQRRYAPSSSADVQLFDSVGADATATTFLFEGRNGIKFDINSSTESVIIKDQEFDSVSPVLFDYFSLMLSDNRPYFSSNISLSFRLAVDLSPCVDCIHLYLPNFFLQNFNNESYPNKYDYDNYLTRVDNKNATIEVIGSRDFEGRWSNTTNSLLLSVSSRLVKGYDYHLLLSGHPMSYFVVSSHGLSNPNIDINTVPMVSFSSSDGSFQTDFVPLSAYPLIFGYSRETTYISLEIDNDPILVKQILAAHYLNIAQRKRDLLRKDEGNIYAVLSIAAEIGMNSIVEGPSYLTFYLPGVINLLENWDGAVPLFNNGVNIENVTFTYFCSNRTFVVRIDGDLLAGTVSIVFANLTSFIVDNAIGVSQHNSIQASDDFYSLRDRYVRRYINESKYINEVFSYFSLQGMNGQLMPSPILYQHTSLTPIILFSSWVLEKTSQDIFFVGYDTLKLHILTNMPPSLDDVFVFKIQEGVVLDFTKAVIDTSVCYVISHNSTNLVTKESLFHISLTNATGCVFQYPSHFGFNITINRVMVIEGYRFVRQHNQNGYASVMWQNNILSSNFIPITQLPSLGLYGSQLELASPLYSAQSPVTFKLITSTRLSKRDQVILHLSNSDLIPTFDQAYVYDSYSRVWELKYDSSAATITFIVPVDILSSAIAFNYNHDTIATEFQNENPINLQDNINFIDEDVVAGMIVDNRRLMFNITGSNTVPRISLRKFLSASLYVQTFPQDMSYVSPVAHLQSTEVYLSRLNNQLMLTSVLKFASAYTLQIEDNVYIEIPYVVCKEFPSLLPNDHGSYEAYCYGRNLVNFRIRQSAVSTQLNSSGTHDIAFSISANSIVSANDLLLCTITSVEVCSVRTRIESKVLPIRDQASPATPVGLFSTSHISVVPGLLRKFLHSAANATAYLETTWESNVTPFCWKNSSQTLSFSFDLLHPLPASSSIVFDNLQLLLSENSTLLLLGVNNMLLNYSDISTGSLVDHVLSIDEGAKSIAMNITTLANLDAGSYVLSYLVCSTFLSETVGMPIVYNSTLISVNYRIQQSGYSHFGLAFSDYGTVKTIGSFGLQYSSISYSNFPLFLDADADSVSCNETLDSHGVIGGSIVVVHLLIAAIDEFKASDKLVVSLPGFRLEGLIMQFVQCNMDDSVVSVSWNSALGTIEIYFHASLSIVDLMLGNFVSPLAGSHSIVNEPSVYYNSTVYTERRVGANISYVPSESVYYGSASFTTAQSIAPRSYMFLQFDFPAASMPSSLSISFFGRYFALNQYDYIDIYLPRVQNVGLSDILLLTSEPTIALDAVFRSQDSTLRLYALSTIRINTQDLEANSGVYNQTLLTVKVQNLRIPQYGIDVHVVQALKVSSNSSFLSGYRCPYISDSNLRLLKPLRPVPVSTTGASDCEDQGFNVYMNMVGYFSESSLTYFSSSPSLHRPAIAFNVSAVLSLQYSMPLDVGDRMEVRGRDFFFDISPSSSVCVLQSNSSILVQSYNIVDNRTLHIVVGSEVPAHTAMAISLGPCISLSANYLSNPPWQNSSSNYVTIYHSNEAITSTSEIQVLGVKGVESAAIWYEVSDMKHPIGIRILLELNVDLAPGDTISIQTPMLRNSNLTAPDIVSLAALGDSISNNRRTPFTAAFDNVHRIIVFSCTDTTEARKLNVFIPEINGLLYDPTTPIIDREHYMSYNLSKFGRAINQRISYSSSSASSLLDAAVHTTVCYADDSPYANPEVIFCDLEVSFEVAQSFAGGETLVLHHNSFYWDSNVVIDSSSIASNAGRGSKRVVSVVGDDIDKFDILYRPRDDAYFGSLSSHIQYAANSNLRITAHTDNIGLPVRTVIDSSALLNNFAIVQNIPYVTHVYLKENSNLPLLCGSNVYVVVRFSRGIYINSSALNRVKVLLNTYETGNYLSHDDRSITFLYTPINPLNTSSLSLFGPAALEIPSAGLIKFGTNSLLDANLTIPSAFLQRLEVLKLNSLIETTAVNCQTNKVRIVDVIVGKNKISGSNVYTAGDVVDIHVQYASPVVVSGKPMLNLVSRTSSTTSASFVNVSSTQHLYIESDGYLSLSLGDTASPCFFLTIKKDGNMDNLASIRDNLLQLPAMKHSLPLVVNRVTQNIDDQALYELVFYGVTPSLLFVDARVCPTNAVRASASVRLPTKFYSDVVFRFEVAVADYLADVPTTLSYAMNAAIITGNFGVVEAPVYGSKIDAVSLLLPLNGTSPSLFAKGIIVDNSRPFVVGLNLSILDVNRDVVSATNRSAVSGDVLRIIVRFSYPVSIVEENHNDFYIPLFIDNLLDDYDVVDTVSLPSQFGRSYQKAVLIFSSHDLLEFQYAVKLGDVKHAPSLPILFGDAIYNTKGLASQLILKASDHPVIETNVSFLSALSTTNADITFDATEIPVILRAYVDPHQLHITAGSLVTIHVVFSANVTVVSTDSGGLAPYVNLTTPMGAIMTYKNGSGSKELSFAFEVLPEQTSGDVSFAFNFHRALIQDQFNRTFASLASHPFYNSMIVVVAELSIDTTVPSVVRVDCNCPDGTYYPGQELDIVVTYNKKVQLFRESHVASNSSIYLELFIPSIGPANRAYYSHGNLSDTLHFSFVVPSPNDFVLQQAFMPLDNNGIASLLLNLQGYVITDVSPRPMTVSNSRFPEYDKSYLFFKRNIYLYLRHAEFVKMSLLPKFPQDNRTSGANEPDVVYTYGDSVYLGLEFSAAVMVSNPAPLLLLQTGPLANRTAFFIGGNNTKMLIYCYVVDSTDSFIGLDIVDTRYPPYNTVDIHKTYALVAFDDYAINQFQSRLSSVFMSSSVSRIPIVTAMPPPPSLALSGLGRVILDTRPPTITNVTLLASNGSYNSLIQLVVRVEFSVQVVLNGCPLLLFMLGNEERYASYYKGNNSNTFFFMFNISKQDDYANLDYYYTSSFKLLPCPGSSRSSQQFIRRLAQRPILDANLTMPPVNTIVSIVSPRSILANGVAATLTESAAYVSNISLPSDVQKVVSLGDVITVNMNFTSYIAVDEVHSSLQLVYLSESELRRLCSASSYDIAEDWLELTGNRLKYANASFVMQHRPSVVTFASAVHEFDSFFDMYNEIIARTDDAYQFPNVGTAFESFIVTYGGVYAVSTLSSSCGFVDPVGKCAAQNLPYLQSFLCQPHSLPQRDLVTPHQLRIASSLDVPTIIDVRFSSRAYYVGEVLIVSITFSQPVMVVDRPQLVLSYKRLDGSFGSAMADYNAVLSASSNVTVQFSLVVLDYLLNSKVYLSANSYIDLKQGEIYRLANFLALVQADIDITSFRSKHISDVLWEVEVFASSAFVQRVYSNNTDVLSRGSVLYIFIEFSSSVRISGEAILLLDIAYDSSVSQRPAAVFYSQLSSRILLFKYVVQQSDYSSAVDYLHSDSLYVTTSGVQANEESAFYLLLPGIYLDRESVNIPAFLALPPRGSSDSLAIASPVVIDQRRPKLISIAAIKNDKTSASFACGDVLFVVLTFDTPLHVVSVGNDASIKLQLVVSPRNSDLAATLKLASFEGVGSDDRQLIFSYLLSSRDPEGTVKLLSLSPLLFSPVNTESSSIPHSNILILSKDTNLSIPLVFPETIVQGFTISVSNAIPFVVKVYSRNSTVYNRPFSAGDVLVFYVQFSVPIRILSGDSSQIVLDLLFDKSVIRQAKYLSYDDDTLFLSYTVLGDDKANRLEYAGIYALRGLIYAASSCDVPIFVSTILPHPYSANSLYLYSIVVDSTPPYISFLTPLKYPGVYGENEEIYILARFNRPVVLSGTPSLALRTKIGSSASSIGFANGTISFPYNETLSIKLQDTDVLFKYVVRDQDEIEDLIHASSNAIVTNRLQRNEILILSSNPAYPANTLLSQPGDFSLVKGELRQQWVYRYARKIDVLLRDIFVDSTNDINLALYHNGFKAPLLVDYARHNLFQNNKSMAKNFNAYLQGTVQSSFVLGEAEGGEVNSNQYSVGQDLHFSDTEGRSIAVFGAVNQSSTIQTGYLAVDGRYSPLINHGSVSETYAEQDPWFILTLKNRTAIQSVAVYERMPEKWVEAIVDLTIKAFGQPPRGYFKLFFSNIVSLDGKYNNIIFIINFGQFIHSKVVVNGIFIYF